MVDKDKILKIAREKGIIKTREIAEGFEVSRQYANKLISELARENRLVKLGVTRYARYVTPKYLSAHPEEAPNYYTKTLVNDSLEEDKIVDAIAGSFLPFSKLGENVKSIFTFAFLEMLNNAIEHSGSKKIKIEVFLKDDELSFVVDDFGVGVYRNIMKKRHLESEMEAIQDLLKGKTTTAPKLHSGEGIFFTSKVGDEFVLDSYGMQFIANNKIGDVFVKEAKGNIQGTKVSFSINITNTHHLNDTFKKYTNQSIDSDYGFDKTEIRVRLYTSGGVYISRSQARRILSGLEKFKIIIMDYEQVPMVGQAFADEVYRVFQTKYPNIAIENVHMNKSVAFMVERAKTEANKQK